MFIHFGLYSIPGGMWKGRRAPHGSELKFSQSYEVARNERRLYVFLPEKAPDTPVTVVKLEIEGEPVTQKL